MRKVVYSLAAAGALAFAPMAAVTVATPAVSPAQPPDCPGGQYWDPTGDQCRPLGEGPAPQNCPGGFWDPVANQCKPLVPGQPPPPQPGQPAPPPGGQPPPPQNG
jgi:hypothetical protein